MTGSVQISETFLNFYWMGAVELSRRCDLCSHISDIFAHFFNSIHIQINQHTCVCVWASTVHTYETWYVRRVCRRSHVRKNNNNKNHFDCFIIYNVHVVCLLVPDAFEINTKSNFHSTSFCVSGVSWSSINPSVGRRAAVAADDDDQIRIFAAFAVHVVENRKSGGQNKSNVCVRMARMWDVSRISFIVFVFFIKKFNYIIIAVSLRSNVFGIGWPTMETTHLWCGARMRKTSWFAVWKYV